MASGRPSTRTTSARTVRAWRPGAAVVPSSRCLPLDLRGELAEGGVVGLAAARERHLRHDGDPHRVRGHAAAVGDERARGGAAASAREEGVDGAVRRDDAGVPVDVGAQALLDGVEVDAQAEDLAAAVASSRRPRRARRRCAGEVAGAQLGRRAAEREVGGLLGVAEHHVGAGVDELADAGPVVDGLVEAQVPAGDRRRRSLSGWSSARSGGRYAIRAVASVGAVHHDEVPPAAAAEPAPAAYGLGSRRPPAWVTRAQRRQVAVLEAAGGQQVEGVRHAGEAGRAGAREEVPEARVDDAQVGQHDARRRRRGGSAAPTGRSSSAAAGW